MVTVVVSKKDVASVNMGEYLLRYFREGEKEFAGYPVYTFQEHDLIIIETLHVHADWLWREYPSDGYVFLSRHSSQSGKKTLSVHPIGNPSHETLGGKPRTLSPVNAHLMSNILRNMLSWRDEVPEYDITFEVTHHGPYTPVPALFLEVGSTEREWEDEEAIRIACEALMRALQVEWEMPRTAVGFGGGHYAPDFTREVREYDIGHMIAKYVEIDDHIIREAVEKTVPRPGYAIISSLKGETRRRVIEELEKMGLEPVY